MRSGTRASTFDVIIRSDRRQISTGALGVQARQSARGRRASRPQPAPQPRSTASRSTCRASSPADAREDAEPDRSTPDVAGSASAATRSSQLWPYETGRVGGLERRATRRRRDRADDRGRRLRHPGRPRTDFGEPRAGERQPHDAARTNSPGDGRGHGTFVAGIAAGGADRLHRAARRRPTLVSVDVMDDHGVARTSDVIAAAQWILANKAQYNIKVANFSLHSVDPSQLLPRPARPGRREALVQRRRRRRGGRQLRHRRQRRAASSYAPGQRPVRDHGRRGRHRRHDRTPTTTSMLRGRPTGCTPDGFMKPDISRARPLHGRPGARRARRSRSERPDNVVAPRLHPALGHVVRGTGRLRLRRRRSWPSIRAARPTRSRAR